MQELTWTITVAVIAALAVVFIFVAARSGDRADFTPIQRGAGRVRAGYFWALAATILAATVVTLNGLPYPRQQPLRGEAQIVDVVAHQWYWEILQPDVVTGRTVEFRVTAADVNHGFGLYDSSVTLLAQTQAMPGYVNALRYTFEAPGIYYVRCLEYCGFAHHAMDATITVRNP